MTAISNSANDCILSKPFVYFRRLSRGHSVKVSGSTSDISPLPNSNVPRPFLRPNKIKWRIKGRLRQTSAHDQLTKQNGDSLLIISLASPGPASRLHFFIMTSLGRREGVWSNLYTWFVLKPPRFWWLINMQ